MRIRVLLSTNAVDEPRPAIRPPLTVDALGVTRAESLARLRDAIKRRTMEGESIGRVFQPDSTDMSDEIV
jgi:hypothetical protein